MTISRNVYNVVPLDGLIADFQGMFYLATAAFVTHPFQIGPAPPPHTFEALARATGLDADEQRRIYKALRGLTDLWARLEPYEEARTWLEKENVLLYAERFPAAGKPVLAQTVNWLIHHFPEQMKRNPPAIHVAIREPSI